MAVAVSKINAHETERGGDRWTRDLFIGYSKVAVEKRINAHQMGKADSWTVDTRHTDRPLEYDGSSNHDSYSLNGKR